MFLKKRFKKVSLFAFEIRCTLWKHRRSDLASRWHDNIASFPALSRIVMIFQFSLNTTTSFKSFFWSHFAWSIVSKPNENEQLFSRCNHFDLSPQDRNRLKHKMDISVSTKIGLFYAHVLSTWQKQAWAYEEALARLTYIFQQREIKPLTLFAWFIVWNETVPIETPSVRP